MKGIILFTSKLKYGVFLSLKMLVYNRYTYGYLGFKVIISSIYEVLVHTSSYGMLQYMIFFPFNANIITILYFLVYILWKKSEYPVVVILDLAWIIYDTKQQNVGISALVLASFGTLWIFYLWCLSFDIYYYYYPDNNIVWIIIVINITA